MFERYVYEQSAAQYLNRIMLVDCDNLEDRTHYSSCFVAHGFNVVRYIDDLHFRIFHFDEIKSSTEKYAVIVKADAYVPYDVRAVFSMFEVSYAKLFPRLNSTVLRKTQSINLDLLCSAYRNCFSDFHISQLTEQFIQRDVYGKDNVRQYIAASVKTLTDMVSSASSYVDWFQISEAKATIDIMATQYDLPAQTEHIQPAFIDFVLSSFGKLSAKMSKDTPVLVSKAMEYIRDQSEKFVVIVMDGMSQFDWNILSGSFSNITYEKTNMFAMIPTTTSVSRQCLLSNKYPSQLYEPWKQSKEKAEFLECAKSLGYMPEQIEYARGYDVDFSSVIRCGAIIINEIDDMVHGQKQGRLGMYNDISVMAKQTKLSSLVQRLLKAGFDVYVTADHGNVPCQGTGKLMKTGVETETKSRRMLVLKDFADKEGLLSQHQLIDYPKYYLSKEFDYLICEAGQSFDAKGEDVMTHGGITIDEVIVPFIKIKAVDNNG